MFTSYDAARRERFALQGATEEQRDGATFLDAIEASSRAADGSIFCQDPHCEAPMTFRNGHTRQGRAVNASWVHRPGTGENCSTSGAPEGEWHRYVKEDIFAAAYAHELAMPGARADAVVRRVNAAKFTAVEIQHSSIKAETVNVRHRAHQAAGMLATLWIVDGNAAGLSTTPEWVDASNDYPGRDWHRGKRVLRISRTWIVDLIAACSAERGYPTTVGLLVGPRGYESLRFISQADIIDVDGSRVAVAAKMTAPVSVDALRDWAAGPTRKGGTGIAAELMVMDSAPTRQLRPIKHPVLVSLNGTGSKVAIGLNAPHKAITDRAESMGLVLAKAGPGRPFMHREGPVTYGRLTGPATPDVLMWLNNDFGFTPQLHAA